MTPQDRERKVTSPRHGRMSAEALSRQGVPLGIKKSVTQAATWQRMSTDGTECCRSEANAHLRQGDPEWRSPPYPYIVCIAVLVQRQHDQVLHLFFVVQRRVASFLFGVLLVSVGTPPRAKGRRSKPQLCGKGRRCVTSPCHAPRGHTDETRRP